MDIYLADILKVASWLSTGFFILIIFLIILYLVRNREGKIQKQAQLPHLSSYQPLICPAEPPFSIRYSSAREIRKFTTMILFMMLLAGGIYLIGGEGASTFVQTVWFLLVLILAANLILHRINRDQKPLIYLDEHALSLQQTMQDGAMLYHEITGIYHSFYRSGYFRNARYVHVIEFVGWRNRLAIPVYALSGRTWAQIINCCLYHNPNIQIDEVVLKIWQKKRIPYLASGPFSQNRQEK